MMEFTEMEVDSAEKPLRQLVMDTPEDPQLPQTIDYHRSQFYVRECYEQYYNQAFDLLQEYELLSITGTTGIFVT
jgi:hypothetical protein